MLFKYPVEYIGITGLYGNRTFTDNTGSNVTEFHWGLDLGWKEPYQDSILAIEKGIVLVTGFDESAGNFIVIRHEDARNIWISRYFHLNAINTVKGALVDKGTEIGIMGSSGDTTGCHLHLEIWKCPLGYTYAAKDKKQYAIDPIASLVAYEDQEISDKSKYSHLVTIVKEPKEEEIPPIADTYLEIFKCPRDDTYYIELKEGQTLYRKQ